MIQLLVSIVIAEQGLPLIYSYFKQVFNQLTEQAKT